MANVQIHTPTEDILKKANEEINITDARGRVITLQKPPFLSQLRMLEALGKERSQIPDYKASTALLYWVRKIDGDDVGPLASILQIEALWQRLDEDGVNAIMLHFMQTMPMDDNAQEAVQAIKKLSGAMN